MFYANLDLNKSVFSFLRTLTTWHCPHPTLLLLLPSAGRAAIDRYLLTAGPTAANLQQRVCCCGPMLGQTDGRTPYRCMEYYAGNANEPHFVRRKWKL